MITRTSRKQRVWRILAAIVVGAIALVGATGYREMRKAQRYSDQAALTAEISRQLAACAERGQYPASLAELPLTFPEKSSPPMLRFFDYHTTGTNCTLRVTFPGSPPQDLSFP
jgi:hypothetical protein